MAVIAITQGDCYVEEILFNLRKLQVLCKEHSWKHSTFNTESIL